MSDILKATEFLVTAEIDRLRADLARVEEERDELADNLAERGIDRNQLLADLRRYGQHDEHCTATRGDVCDCGFSDALTPRR